MFPPEKGSRGLPEAARSLSWRLGAIALCVGAGGPWFGVLQLAGSAGEAPMTVNELRERLKKIPDDKQVYVYGEGAIEKFAIDDDGDVTIIADDD